MKRTTAVTSLIMLSGFLYLFMFTVHTFAQEVTPDTPTVIDMTADAPILIPDDPATGVIIVNPPPIETPAESPRPLLDGESALVLSIGLLVSISLGGGAILIFKRFLERKDVQDAVEAKYLEQPAGTQEVIQGTIAVLDKAADVLNSAVTFLQRVTDGKPNSEPPATSPPGKSQSS